MSDNRYWRRGQKAAIARLAGIPKQYLSDVLHRRRDVSKRMAERLAQASTKVGVLVPFMDWLYCQSSAHPAFYGEAKPTEGDDRD